MNEEQYRLVCARRNVSAQLIWQAPILACTAQAFLLAPAFNPGIERGICVVLAAFSFALGVASIQLLARHQRLDEIDRERLAQFEDEHAAAGYAPVHAPPKFGIGPLDWLACVNSFRVWIAILAGFCLLALFAAFSAATRPEPPAALPAVAQPPTPLPPAAPKPRLPSRIEVSPAKKAN